MRQAIIKDGRVTNICIGSAGGIDLPEGSQVCIGWTYDGSIFIPPAIKASDIQAKITALEVGTQMNRFVREAMILISIQQAAGIGVTEPQLYAANLGYRKVKALDDQITALRLQMEAL